MDHYRDVIFDILDKHRLIHFILLDEHYIVRYVSHSLTHICKRKYFELIQTSFKYFPLFFSHKNSESVPIGEELDFKKLAAEGVDDRNVYPMANGYGGSYVFYIATFDIEVDNQTLTSLVLIDQHYALEVKQNADLFELVMSDVHYAIFLTDQENKITRVNQAFEKMTGYSEEEIIGQNPSLLGGGYNNPDFYQRMWYQLLKDDHWDGVFVNRRKNGEVFSAQSTLRVLRDNLDQISGYMGLFTEAGNSIVNEPVISNDALTGLPSRVIFIDRLNQAIGYARRHKKNIVVFSINLDKFREVNDNFGKQAGDEVIKKIAQKLNSAVRVEDAVARLSGDEFAIMISGLDNEKDVDGFIKRLLSVFAKPQLINDIRITTTASIGLTSFPDDDCSASQLLRHAMHAMDIAKSEGGNCIIHYSTKHQQQKAEERLARDQVFQALDKNQMRLFIQPQYDVHNQSLYGIEMLIRWQNEGDLIGPDEFLNDQKNPDLLIAVDKWVIKTTILLLQDELTELVEKNIKVNINITPSSLQDYFFHQWLVDQLRLAPLDITRILEIDILENDALDNIESLQQLIERVSKYQVSFALDDFGTGYGSLRVFNQLDVRTVKIDKYFVQGMAVDHKNLSMVSIICGMAEKYGRGLVAEGVEFPEQVDLLSGFGCKVMQGFGIARPMPVSEFSKWIQTMPLSYKSDT